MTGLSPNTQYGFRICAYNSDLSQFSAGITNFTTTTLSGLSWSTASSANFIFSTAANYSPSFGNSYFANFVCQVEALNAGLNGSWKAIIGDDSTAATSRISFQSNLYNMRPAASGGSQQVSNSSTFWTGSLLYPLNYTASGGAPGSNRVRTGMANGGALNSGLSCTSWSSASAGVNSSFASNNVTGTNQYINNGNVACNNNYGLFCVNNQTSDAVPSNPATFTVGVKTTSSIQLNWTTGGGTTAAYQIAYAQGATAPRGLQHRGGRFRNDPRNQ